MAPRLLIAGGELDPNLEALQCAAGDMAVDVRHVRIGPDRNPGLVWDLDEGRATLDGRPLDVDAAFVRYDVFHAMQDPRPAVARRAGAWHEAVSGWLFAHPSVRVFNRAIGLKALNKPAQLGMAREAGLRVPRTLLTNDFGHIDGLVVDRRVVKPVAGGDYCVELDKAMSTATRRGDLVASPALVQPQLPSPEVRVYVIGDETLAFELQSDAVDYRTAQQVRVTPRSAIPAEAGRLRDLMGALDMDFGAADFRTDPDSGELVFLELNTSPMFARFNAECGGRLCRAMVSTLCGRGARRVPAGGERWPRPASMPARAIPSGR